MRVWGPVTAALARVLCGALRAVGAVGGRPGGQISYCGHGRPGSQVPVPLYPVRGWCARGGLALARQRAFLGAGAAHLLPFGLWYVCFVALVCSSVACGSLLLFTCGCPSYHTSFRVDGLESIRRLQGGGFVFVAVICSAAGTLVFGRLLVSLPAYALLDYTLLCSRRFILRACMGIPLCRLAPAGSSLLPVFCGLVCLLCLSVLCSVFRGRRPLVAFTHLACLMASASYACGGCAGVLSCW